MAEFVGGKSVVVDVGKPITFENKTDADFNVSYGVVFRKSGLYRVSVNGKHTSITIEPERKTGKWIWKTRDVYKCSECETETHVDECMEEPIYNFCPYCGARLVQEGEDNDRA